MSNDTSRSDDTNLNVNNNVNDFRKKLDEFKSSLVNSQPNTSSNRTNMPNNEDWLLYISMFILGLAFLFLYITFHSYNNKQYHQYNQFGFYALVCFYILDFCICVGFLFTDKSIPSMFLYSIVFLYFVACTVLIYLGYQKSKILASLIPDTNQRLNYWDVMKFLTSPEQQKEYNDAISYTEKIIMGLVIIFWIPILLVGGGRIFL